MEILLPRMNFTYEIIGKHGESLLPERASEVKRNGKTRRVYWVGYFPGSVFR